jgi:FMN phosphatase YigB (HAD superfamily)
VIVSAGFGWRKPRPEIFEEAFERMGLDPAEAVFVGDASAVDVPGARAVGIHAIWLAHGVKSLPPRLASPTHPVSQPEEMLDVL